MSETIFVAIWGAENGCVQGDLLLLIHPRNKFLSSSIVEGKNSTLGSSVAPCKWDDLHLQIWAWWFFPEICSVDLMGRVHVKAPVHGRLGLGTVDGCGGS